MMPPAGKTNEFFKDMENNILKIGVLLLAAATLFSCKKTLENVLSKEIAINDRSVTFTVDPATRAGEAEETLYDGVLQMNVAAELEKNGFSFENIKSFVLKQVTLELVTPSGYDMEGFKTVKLYFDNKSKLVARADKVEGDKVRFTVADGSLLDQLKEDSLHIILTGQRPSKQVKLKLAMDYAARVSLIK